MSPPPGQLPIHFRRASQLAPRALAWLWPGRLALGKLALLDGDPGLGKSLVALDLCARLSTGRPLPDDAPGPGPCNALVLNGEDGTEDTLRPRLQALGADLERVFVLARDEAAAGLSLPGHLDVLAQALRQTQARLVVVDPIMAFLDAKVISVSDQGIRRLLTPLARLAQECQAAVVLVRHLTKGGGRQALYRGAGSIGLLGACRSGWLVARDPKAAGRCVLAQVKNNLAPRQPSLAYEMVHAPAGPPTLSWLGPAAWTADELVAAAARGSARRRRERARELLEEFLAQGPRTSREVWDWARRHGLAERTLNRAKKDLGIRAQLVCEGSQRRTYRLLPLQEVPAPAAAADADDSLEPWLQPLRERFPPSTPLDEE
jgi:hypothetical protein